MMAADTPLRVANDLFEAAVREGAAEQRSARAQIDHWARVGLRVTRRNTVTRRRIEQAMAGELPWSELLEAERNVANAQIDAAIDEAATQVELGAVAADAGVTTVALDEEGQLREYSPDGSSRLL